MAESNLRKAGISFLVLVAVVAVAVVLGTHAGGLVREWRQLEQRDESTAMMLTDMKTLEIGGKLPDHTLENLEYSDVRLSHLLMGRTVVCFFETGCGTCLRELEEMQATLPDSLLRRIILISAEDRANLKKARDDYDIQSAILWDRDALYTQSLRIVVRPFNVVVDSTLTIENIVGGKLTGAEFAKIMSD